MPMSENDERKSRGHTKTWVALSIVAPVMYALSVAPLWWLYFRGGSRSPDSIGFAISIYDEPLEWASERCSLLKSLALPAIRGG